MRILSVIMNQRTIPFATLNLLVGSNNTGKSTLLRELHGAITSGMIHAGESKWLDSAQLEIGKIQDEIKVLFREDDISKVDNLEPRQVAETVGFKPFRNNMSQNLRSYGLSSIFSSSIYTNNTDIVIDIPKLESSNQLGSTDENIARRFLADIEVLSEFCDSRLSGGFNANVSDILQNDNDQSLVRHLLESPELLRDIQNNIQNVFGVRIGFDDLQQGQKPLRILPREKFSKKLDQKRIAMMWREKSPMIDSQGDGLRAYLKLALSLLDPFSKMIFIDEPETFLHPPQRRALGGLIADMAKQQKKQVCIATHDSEFIRGLLNTASDVKVLNLKNRYGAHEVVDIGLKDIKSIMSQKGNRLKERVQILNESILNSLFYDKTILTEDENDRVFYEYYSTLRHRVAVQDKRFIGLRGIDEVLMMMEKLNSIGVNVTSIVDIDFLVTKHAPQYIQQANPNLHIAHEALIRAYKDLQMPARNSFFVSLKKNGLKGIVDDSLRQQYECLIDGYGKVGIYVPKSGDLESWTKTSKNNLSQMLRIIEHKNPRELNRFMKEVLR